MAATEDYQRIINLTIGPMQIGNFLNAILLGVVLLQTGQYYILFKDPPFVRRIVGFVALLDVLQTAIMMYMTWEYSVAHFGDFSFASKSIWALSSIPFYCVPIAWIVQGFYAWRIWTLTGRKLVPILIIASSAISGLAGIGCGIGSFLVNSTYAAILYAETVPISLTIRRADNIKLEKVAIIWFLFAMLCDVMIMAGMFWTLLGMKTGIKDTDSLITKINRTVIGTGLASTLTVMIDCIFLFRIGGTDMHLIPVMIVGKVYSNSLLYLLNSRVPYRKITVVSHTIGGMAKSFDQRHETNSSGSTDVESGRPRKRKIFSEMKFTPFEALSTTGNTSGVSSLSKTDDVSAASDAVSGKATLTAELIGDYELVDRAGVETNRPSATTTVAFKTPSHPSAATSEVEIKYPIETL